MGNDPRHILTHNLDDGAAAIVVRDIVHQNQYDFTQQHRHNYFEVMFFEQGGGKNLIDLVQYEVHSQACYMIYPGQIHLLNRAPASHGVVLQFQMAAIDSPLLQRLLQEQAWSGRGAVLFEDDAAAMQHHLPLVARIGAYARSNFRFRQAAQQHLLQALLLDLLSAATGGSQHAALDPVFYQFLQLVDLHFKEEQRVAAYLDRLVIPEKKLAALAQKYRGRSPLQIIHERILLEAKRLLATAKLPHKEIAYDLGFDSPASFSAFVKKKTGHTPSEIQSQLAEIQKH